MEDLGKLPTLLTTMLQCRQQRGARVEAEQGRKEREEKPGRTGPVATLQEKPPLSLLLLLVMLLLLSTIARKKKPCTSCSSSQRISYKDEQEALSFSQRLLRLKKGERSTSKKTIPFPSDFINHRICNADDHSTT